MDNLSEALCRGIELRMPQESADVARNLSFVFRNVHVNQSIGRMTKRWFVEISVFREERWSLEAMQNRKNVFVADAFFGDFFPDDPNGDAPLTQPPDFDLGDVLVDK